MIGGAEKSRADETSRPLPGPSAIDNGRFRCDPDPSMRPFVVEYWGLARDLAAMGGFTITPDRFGELICCADDLHVVEGGERQRLPTCFTIGLLDGPLRIEADGIVRCMAARLQPWTIGRFQEVDPGPSASGWRPAHRLLGDRLPAIVERVRLRDWPALAGLFEQSLREEVARWPVDLSAAEIVDPFLGSGPRPTMGIIRDRWTSRRQVERRVRALTGTSPKRLASLSRFQLVRDALWANPSTDLARLAIASGYADQPHMTREFRRYAGRTPARFAREATAQKIRIAAQDVAIVQERPASDK